jgi:hypothetical protein
MWRRLTKNYFFKVKKSELQEKRDGKCLKAMRMSEMKISCLRDVVGVAELIRISALFHYFFILPTTKDIANDQNEANNGFNSLPGCINFSRQ